MNLSHLEAQERVVITLYVSLTCGSFNFLHNEFVLAPGICFAFLVKILSFLFPIRKGGKIGIQFTFPGTRGGGVGACLHPPIMQARLPKATHSCKAFLLLGFSLNRSEIAAPMVFLKLTLSWF